MSECLGFIYIQYELQNVYEGHLNSSGSVPFSAHEKPVQT